MNIDEHMVEAIVQGAMPFLVVLVVFGAPVLFAYLRWSFKLREKELDLQRELALRGLGGVNVSGLPTDAGEARVRVAGGANAPAPEAGELDLVVPELRADRLLSAPGAGEHLPGEQAVGERVKF